MLKTKAIVSKWGNSQALRIPAEIIRQLGIHTNDEVILEVSKAKLTVTKSSTPREGTIEHLFKDYSGGSFRSELLNPTVPVGAEQW
jgi:antitoxin MazE